MGSNGDSKVVDDLVDRVLVVPKNPFPRISFRDHTGVITRMRRLMNDQDRVFVFQEHKELLEKRPTVFLHTRYGDLFFCIPPGLPDEGELLTTAFGASFKSALSKLVKFKCNMYFRFMTEYWNILDAIETGEIARALSRWIGPGGTPMAPVAKMQLLIDSITLNADELRGRYVRTALGQMLDAETEFLDDVSTLDERGTTILQTWHQKHGVATSQDTLNLLAFHCNVLPSQIKTWFERNAKSVNGSGETTSASSSASATEGRRSGRRSSSKDDSVPTLTLGQLASIMQQIESPESARAPPPQLALRPVGRQYNPNFSAAIYPSWRWKTMDIGSFADLLPQIEVPLTPVTPQQQQQLEQAQRLAIQQMQHMQQAQKQHLHRSREIQEQQQRQPEVEQQQEEPQKPQQRVTPFRVPPEPKPVAPRTTAIQVPVRVYNVQNRYAYDIREDYQKRALIANLNTSPPPAPVVPQRPSPPPQRKVPAPKPVGRPRRPPPPPVRTPYIAELEAKKAAATNTAPPSKAQFSAPMPQPIPAVQSPSPLQQTKSTAPLTPEEREEREYQRKRERHIARLMVERQRREHEKQDDDDDPIPPGPYIVALPSFISSLESRVQRATRRSRASKNAWLGGNTDAASTASAAPISEQPQQPLEFCNLTPCLPAPAPLELSPDEKDWFAGVVATCSLVDALDEEIEKDSMLLNEDQQGASSSHRHQRRQRKMLNPTRSAVADLTMFRLQQMTRHDGAGYTLRKRNAEKAKYFLERQQQQQMYAARFKRDRPTSGSQPSASVMPPAPKRAKINEQQYSGRGRSPAGPGNHHNHLSASSSSQKHGYQYKGGIVDAVMENQIKQQLEEKVQNYGFTSFGTTTLTTSAAPRPLTVEERESYQLRLREASTALLQRDSPNGAEHRGVTRLWLKHTFAKRKRK
eukprot:TRINITY_DN4096_c0_g2_i1.p1 TRINITY_DN4096_c0_g2~~TRINITY_DN4096_c0_g2_i1.p1  ORF type:complete len:920 (+),score=131.91 TRINITY_DN4096_c0_g2_i1:165-2924(+)